MKGSKTNTQPCSGASCANCGTSCARGRYQDYATDPRSCLVNQGHCYGASGYSLEASSWGSCSAEEGRQGQSHARFFWDIYDEVDDGVESIDLNLFNIFDSIAATPCPNWPECYGAGQAHDAFNSVSDDLSSSSVVCADCGNAGRSATTC